MLSLFLLKIKNWESENVPRWDLHTEFVVVAKNKDKARKLAQSFSVKWYGSETIGLYGNKIIDFWTNTKQTSIKLLAKNSIYKREKIISYNFVNG